MKKILTEANIISHEEFNLILSELSRQRYKTLRSKFQQINFCFQLCFMYFMGLRPDSVRLIEVKHIDFRRSCLFVPRSNIKTRQDDIFPLHRKIKLMLVPYLKLRCRLFKKNIYLFPSVKNGRPVSRYTVSANVRDIMRRNNIGFNSFVDKSGFLRRSKNLYSLRHSFATEVYNQTKSIADVGKMLGHVDKFYRQASRYVHINKKDGRQDIIDKIFI